MRPENAKQGILYFIRFSPTIYKVGITSDWKRRSKELKVGRNNDSICKAVMVRNVENPGRLEKIILQKYDNCRLPGSEYLKLNIGQVANIKNMISDKNAYQQVFKHWDTGRRKNIIDLEIALQDEPELIEKYRRIQNNSQTRKKIPKKKDSWQKGLLIVFIFLIPPIFFALLIVEFFMLLSGQKGPLSKLFE
tara:strand:+ start:67 stop:642 length:576 start_codon:yes stop_codon:yes gene_type:complete